MRNYSAKKILLTTTAFVLAMATGAAATTYMNPFMDYTDHAMNAAPCPTTHKVAQVTPVISPNDGALWFFYSCEAYRLEGGLGDGNYITNDYVQTARRINWPF